MRAYATYDPRKGTHVAGNGGGDHPYQEIPYGDGPGPRGPIPEVPQHYAQVPPPPQRQGMLAGSISPLSCALEKIWFSPLAGTVAHGCQTLMVGVPDSCRQSCEVCPVSTILCQYSHNFFHCVSLTSDILCSRWFDAWAGGGHFSICHFPPSGNERGGDFQIQQKYSDICLQSVQ